MSALAWTRFRHLVKPSRVLRVIICDIAKFIEEKRARLSPYATLERCSNKLEHLRSLVLAISPRRRRKIQTAADRGVCKYITDVELILEACVPLLFHLISPLCLWIRFMVRFYIDYYKLCELHQEFPFVQRYWPSTRLHQYMLDLEYDIQVFFRDVWVSFPIFESSF